MQADKPSSTTPMDSPQFQVKRSAFIQQQLVEIPAEALVLQPGEIQVEVEKFAYTANNITYAVAGDTIGYWKFFPPVGTKDEIWGRNTSSHQSCATTSDTAAPGAQREIR
ncbi:MAG: DUF2855 family protein, partial [Bacteroidota bacterium]